MSEAAPAPTEADAGETPAKKNGPPYDPQGGRVHNVGAKVNVYEGEALREERLRVETLLKRKMKDSEFIRYRLLNGGEALSPNYPPPPIDTRRERRGSVPKTTGKRPPRARSAPKPYPAAATA